MLIVTGVFNSRNDAKQAIRTLGRSGFLVERLSIVRAKNQAERFSAEAILEEWGTIETFVKAEDASKIDAAT
jgi:hypothetical protein